MERNERYGYKHRFFWGGWIGRWVLNFLLFFFFFLVIPLTIHTHCWVGGIWESHEFCCGSSSLSTENAILFESGFSLTIFVSFLFIVVGCSFRYDGVWWWEERSGGGGGVGYLSFLIVLLFSFLFSFFKVGPFHFGITLVVFFIIGIIRRRELAEPNRRNLYLENR